MTHKRNDLDFLFDNGLESVSRFYSFYMGYIEDSSKYPLLQVHVPSLRFHGQCLNALNWGGQWWGKKDPRPIEGDYVWVIFRSGDISSPYWLPAGWFDPERVPEDLKPVNVWGIVSPNGNKFIVDEDTGNVTVSALGDISIDAAGVIKINQGQNNGLIKIQELTDKINNLVQELETLRNAFNTHTHPGVQAGPGVTSPTLTQASKPFTQFNKSDYENTKVLQ